MQKGGKKLSGKKQRCDGTPYQSRKKGPEGRLKSTLSGRKFPFASKLHSKSKKTKIGRSIGDLHRRLWGTGA